MYQKQQQSQVDQNSMSKDRSNKSSMNKIKTMVFDQSVKNMPTGYMQDTMTDYTHGKLVAVQLFKIYDVDPQESLPDKTIERIIKDTYEQINVKYQPTKKDIEEYKDMLDLNKDSQVTINDIESGIYKRLVQPSEEHRSVRQGSQVQSFLYSPRLDDDSRKKSFYDGLQDQRASVRSKASVHNYLGSSHDMASKYGRNNYN